MQSEPQTLNPKPRPCSGVGVSPLLVAQKPCGAEFPASRVSHATGPPKSLLWASLHGSEAFEVKLLQLLNAVTESPHCKIKQTGGSFQCLGMTSTRHCCHRHTIQAHPWARQGHGDGNNDRSSRPFTRA